jgi:hypothetical protein
MLGISGYRYFGSPYRRSQFFQNVLRLHGGPDNKNSWSMQPSSKFQLLLGSGHQPTNIATLEAHVFGATDNKNLTMLCKASTLSNQQLIKPV